MLNNNNNFLKIKTVVFKLNILYSYRIFGIRLSIEYTRCISNL